MKMNKHMQHMVKIARKYDWSDLRRRLRHHHEEMHVTDFGKYSLNVRQAEELVATLQDLIERLFEEDADCICDDVTSDILDVEWFRDNIRDGINDPRS